MGFSWKKCNEETSFTSLLQIFRKTQVMLFLRFRFLFEKANINLTSKLKIKIGQQDTFCGGQSARITVQLRQEQGAGSGLGGAFGRRMGCQHSCCVSS